MSLEKVVGPGFEPGSSISSMVKALKNVECIINSEEIYCFSGLYFMWTRTFIFFFSARVHCNIF